MMMTSPLGTSERQLWRRSRTAAACSSCFFVFLSCAVAYAAEHNDNNSGSLLFCFFVVNLQCNFLANVAICRDVDMRVCLMVHIYECVFYVQKNKSVCVRTLFWNLQHN